MTEEEWLASNDPVAMLRRLTDGPMQAAAGRGRNPLRPSDRKLRLFACACCRQEWECIPLRGREAVRLAETLADGGGTEEERQQYHDTDVTDYGYLAARACCFGDSAQAAQWVVERLREVRAVEYALGELPRRQADILRDITGNPFRRGPLGGWSPPEPQPDLVAAEPPARRRPGRGRLPESRRRRHARRRARLDPRRRARGRRPHRRGGAVAPALRPAAPPRLLGG